MKDKKIFFFDIDGTLAIGTNVSDSTKKALDLLRKKGYYIFICTGRPYEYAYKYFKDYVDGFITCNGRYIRYKETLLLDEPINQQAIVHYINVMRKYHCGFAFLDSHQGYLESKNEDVINNVIKAYYPDFFKLDFNDNEVKGYMFDIHFPTIEDFNNVQEELKDEVLFNRHYPMFSADATIMGVDKGKGIDKVLEYFDISIDNAYVFGDGTNDICMFNHLKHTIAMGNAIDELKEKAEYITDDCNQNGIYNALVHYHII
jgi:hypothetical protein